MLPGFSGHLLSESFLEHCLAGTADAAAWPTATESGDRRVRALAAKLKVETPICEAVAAILAGQVGIDDAIGQLLSRPIRAEF